MANITPTENVNEILQQLTESISPFLKNNSAAILKADDERLLVVNPWDDESLGFEIALDNKELIDALNNLLLPSPLSAIYHIDTSTIEFIFTVTSPDNPLWSRKFEFIYDGCPYQCQYGESSDRLLQMAKATQLMEPTSLTEYRNLRIFRDYCNQSKLPVRLVQFFEDKKPMSFFCGPVSAENTEHILELARHINFYMSFFDRGTPKIIFHKLDDAVKHDKQGLADPLPFPEKILGTQIKTYMLDLWAGAKNDSGRLAFLYYYQMLEYATFYFIEDKVRLKIEKILRRPDILSSTSSYLGQAIDEIVILQQSDDFKFDAVIARSVSPEKMWGIIEQYKEYFSKPQEFDGGFRIDALIPKDLSADGFCGMWTPKVQHQLRKIRNALVHSREKREDKAIAPTRANTSKLQPWVELIEEIACQVAINQDI
jgi:hypothetical protein